MKHFARAAIFGLSLGLTGVAAQAAELPKLDHARTAVVITDPQNEFLREDGKLYGLLKDNLQALGTVKNIETLMKTADGAGLLLAVDPLVFTQADAGLQNAGALQRQLLDMKALYRASTADARGFEGSGADFYDGYKKYIHNGRTLIVAPHKMYGPESNDLVYQLRNRNIDTVVLAGLVANLCVDSHLRTLMENGFRVYVVKDAVGAPGDEAYQAALTNYAMIANGVWTTAEAVAALKR